MVIIQSNHVGELVKEGLLNASCVGQGEMLSFKCRSYSYDER